MDDAAIIMNGRRESDLSATCINHSLNSRPQGSVPPNIPFPSTDGAAWTFVGGSGIQLATWGEMCAWGVCVCVYTYIYMRETDGRDEGVGSKGGWGWVGVGRLQVEASGKSFGSRFGS